MRLIKSFKSWDGGNLNEDVSEFTIELSGKEMIAVLKALNMERLALYDTGNLYKLLNAAQQTETQEAKQIRRELVNFISDLLGE